MNKFSFCTSEFSSRRINFALSVGFLSIFFVFNQSVFAQLGASGAIVAIDEVKEGSGSVKTSQNPGFQSKTSNSSTEKKNLTKTVKNKVRSKTNTATANNQKSNVSRTKDEPPNKKYDGFVVGDKYSFLNFEVVKRVQPIYTIKAKEAGASGLVQVEILVGENGKVLTAKARTGNSLLYAEAEKAALATVLNKPTVYGKPARAIGFLVYRFGNALEE